MGDFLRENHIPKFQRENKNFPKRYSVIGKLIFGQQLFVSFIKAEPGAEYRWY